MSLLVLCRIASQINLTKKCVYTSFGNWRRKISFSKFFTSSTFYSENHEWVRLDEGELGTIGLTDYAQEKLGEIVYVDLPELDLEVDEGAVAGCVESVKAASDVYSPVKGSVVQVNERLREEPGLVNKHPLDDGWIFQLKLFNPTDIAKLMDDKTYAEYLQNQK